MSNTLKIALLLFSIIMFVITCIVVRKGKMPIKYSLIWYLVAVIIFFLSVLPDALVFISNLFGFQTISNLIIGIFLSLLLIITMVLTIIVSNQRKEIKQLVQEISIVKSGIHNEKK